MERPENKLSESVRRSMKKHYEETASFAVWSEHRFRILPRQGQRKFVPFKHNTIQQSVGRKIQESGKRHVVAVMPRRTGKSIYFSAKAVHITSRDPNRFVLMTSFDQKQAQKALKRLKLYTEASPSVANIDGIDIPIMPKLLDTGKDEMTFCFDHSSPRPLEFSRIDVDTAGAGESVGRGEDYDYVLLMEAGMPQYHSYATYMAAYQCLPVGSGLFVMEGTPYGAVGPMYDKFVEADSDPANSEFIAIFEAWTSYPEYSYKLLPGEDPESWTKGIRYDTKVLEPENGFEVELLHEYGVSLPQLKWARSQVRTGFGKTEISDPYENFHQEYPIDKERCWLVQGSSVFHVGMIQAGLKRAQRAMEHGFDEVSGRKINQVRYRAIYDQTHTPRLEQDQTGPWRFLEPPDRDARSGQLTGVYVISIDVAEGTHDGDYTVVTVAKRTQRGPDRVVGMCRLRDPYIWGIAKQIAIVGRMYNTAWLMPEANSSMGGTICSALMNGTDYPYHRIYVMPGEAEVKYSGYKKQVGWLTTPKSKPEMIEHLHDALFINYKNPASDEGLECLFPEYWWEAKTFTHEGVGMRASKGNTDDCVISLAINNYGLRKWVPNPRVIELKKHILVPGQPIRSSTFHDAFDRAEPVERYA